MITKDDQQPKPPEDESDGRYGGGDNSEERESQLMLLRGRGLFVSSPPAHRPQYGRRGLRRERSFSVSGLMPTPALSSNAGVARSGLQNRGLQVRFLLGLFLNGYASG